MSDSRNNLMVNATTSPFSLPIDLGLVNYKRPRSIANIDLLYPTKLTTQKFFQHHQQTTPLPDNTVPNQQTQKHTTRTPTATCASSTPASTLHAATKRVAHQAARPAYGFAQNPAIVSPCVTHFPVSDMRMSTFREVTAMRALWLGSH